MNNEKLKSYLATYVSYLNKIKSDDAYIPTKTDLKVLSSLSKLRMSDDSLNKLLTDLARKESIDRQHRMVAEYIMSKDTKRKIKSQNKELPKKLTLSPNMHMGGYTNIFIISLITLIILIILGIIYKIST